MNLAVARLVLAWVPLLGAGARAETLTDMLSRVYVESPRLESGRANLRAIDETVPAALAPGRPQLGTSNALAYNVTGDALPTQRQALSLSQSIYAGGAIAAATRRAESQVQAERARLAQLEQDVLLEAVAAYSAVARDGTIVDLARANEDRLRVQLDATRDRERFGDATKTDIYQAQSRHAGAIAERDAAEGALEESMAEYRRLAGTAPGPLALPPLPGGLPATLDDALAEAEASWRWQAATFELAAARDDVAVAVGGMKPRLTLGAELSYAEDGGGAGRSGGNAAIGATLAVPLYQGGGEYARVRQSKETVTRRRYDRDDARRAAEAEIAAAWEASRAAQSALRALQVQVDAATFAVDGVRQEAKIGARSVLDVLDAERERFTAEVALVRTERDQVLATYRLLAAVGRLTARDLELPVAYYDPDTHFRAARRQWFGLGPKLGAD